MRKFLKKCLFALLRGVLIMAMLYGISFAVLFLYLERNKPHVPKSCVLVVDISTPWSEGPIQGGVFSKLREQFMDESAPTNLLQTVDSIRRAKSDPRVKGILITGDIMFQPSTIGLTGYAELAQAVADFSEVKPSFAYLANPGLPEMLIASHCRYRFINPSGMVFFKGIGTETLFWGEAFERYGVGIQAVRAGNFKSATEPYTRKGFSPEAKAQQQRLVDALWETYTHSFNPELTNPQQLDVWANEKGLLPPTALQNAGFADLLEYDRLLVLLSELAGPDTHVPHTFAQCTIQDYNRVGKVTIPENTPSARVAVIALDGVIGNENGSYAVDGASFARQLRQIRTGGQYQGVLLRVNSPGGAVFPSKLIAREVELLSEKMPVVVSMGQYAASGGYWVSLYGTEVSASPLTLTGSVGVFALAVNVEKASQELGLNWEGTSSTDLSGLFSITSPKSEKELHVLQTYVDSTYTEFQALVSDSRGLPETQIAELTEGRVWTGNEALPKGLVDRMGGYSDSLFSLREQLNVQRLDIDYISKPNPTSTFSLLGLVQGTPLHSILSGPAEQLSYLMGMPGPYAYTPLTLQY